MTKRQDITPESVFIQTVKNTFPQFNFTEEIFGAQSPHSRLTLHWSGKVISLSVTIFMGDNKKPSYCAAIHNSDYKCRWGKVYFWQKLNQSLPLVLARLKEFICTKVSSLHEDLSKF